MIAPDPLAAERQRRPAYAEAKLRLRAGRRRARNWALFAVLGGFAVLVYAITIVKIRLGYGP
jgi:hypothetical protein